MKNIDIPDIKLLPSGFLDNLSKVLLKEVDTNFVVGGRPSWKSLKDSTRTPLIKTGNLRHSILTSMSKNSLVIYSTTSYATYHLNGTKRIPVRDFLNIPNLEDIIEKLYTDMVEKENR